MRVATILAFVSACAVTALAAPIGPSTLQTRGTAANIISNIVDGIGVKIGYASETTLNKVLNDIADEAVEAISLSKLKAAYRAYDTQYGAKAAFNEVYDRVVLKLEGKVLEPITKKEAAIVRAMAESNHPTARNLLNRIPIPAQKELGLYRYLNPKPKPTKELLVAGILAAGAVDVIGAGALGVGVDALVENKGGQGGSTTSSESEAAAAARRSLPDLESIPFDLEWTL